jgi:hypothetical protein
MKKLTMIMTVMLVCFGTLLVGKGTLFSNSLPTESKASNMKIEYSFIGAEGLKGWEVTKTASAITHDNFLEIQGRGNDAKIYRVINLPAGHYTLSGCAAEKTRVRIIKTDWKTVLLDFDLSHGKDTFKRKIHQWRTDYRYFDVTGNSNAYLTVETEGNKSTAKIKAISIEAAPQEQYDSDTPTPRALELTSAELPVVRGFMSGYLGAVDGHITPTDGNVFKDMRSWGANVARLDIWPAGRWKAMATDDFWQKGLPVLLNYIESSVMLARKAGIKVVLDCHYPPPVGTTLLDHGREAFWKNPATAASLCRLWKAIAERMLPYQDTIYGYDLFNEPLDKGQLPHEPREWRAIAIQILKTIRTVDKDVWIIYEPGPGSLVGGFKGLVPLPDTHVIYSPHFYYPFEFCAQGVTAIEGTDLQRIMAEIHVHYPSTIGRYRWDKARLEQVLSVVDDFQKKWHVPIYVGEFSVVRWAPKKDAAQWLTDVIDLFETRGWSWSYHAFRESNLWSLEHNEKYQLKGTPTPRPVPYETERAKVIKKALAKNWSEPY